MQALKGLATPTTVVLLLILLAPGCGNNDEYATVPVSGVVTCKGKPVANATVNFSPLRGQGRAEDKTGRLALGMTDKDGRFTLTTYENNDGAIVGKHVVTVSLNIDEATGRGPKGGFPCQDSSMEVEVKSGMGEVKIDF